MMVCYVCIACVEVWCSVLQCVAVSIDTLELRLDDDVHQDDYVWLCVAVRCSVDWEERYTTHWPLSHERVREADRLGGPLTNSLMTKWSMSGVSLEGCGLWILWTEESEMRQQRIRCCCSVYVCALACMYQSWFKVYVMRQPVCFPNKVVSGNVFCYRVQWS